MNALEPSPFPYAPLAPWMIPSRLQVAAMDHGLAHGGVDSKQLLRISCDLEKRAEIDAYTRMTLEREAEQHAAVLAEIDALHIRWGQTDMTEINVVELWERLGELLRKAGL